MKFQSASSETAEVPTPSNTLSGIARILGRAIYATLLLLITLATIAYGGADPLWKAVFTTAILAVSILAVFEITLSNYPKPAGIGILLPVLVLIVFAYLQTLPLSTAAPPGSGIELQFWNSISADPYETRIFALQLLALMLFTGMLLRYASPERRLRRLIHLIIAVSVASAVFGMLRQTMQHGPGFGLPMLLPEQGYGQFINKNHFAYLMEMGLGLVLGLLAAGGVRRDQVLIYLAVSLPIWMALVLANSRGAILAMLGQVVVTLLLFPMVVRVDQVNSGRAWKVLTAPFVRVALVVSLLLFCIIGVFWVGGDRLANNIEAARLEFGGPEESNLGVNRLRIWRDTLDLIKANPIVGVGMGGYWAAIPRYHDAAGSMTPQQAHNDYLEIIASGGLVGLAIFLWFVFLVFKRGRANLQSPDAFRRATSFAGLVAIAGVAIHSLMDFGLHRMANAMIFVALIVIVTGGISKQTATRNQNAQG